MQIIYQKFGYKKSPGINARAFCVVEDLEISNLLEDFYKVVELYDYIVNFI